MTDAEPVHLVYGHTSGSALCGRTGVTKTIMVDPGANVDMIFLPHEDACEECTGRHTLVQLAGLDLGGSSVPHCPQCQTGPSQVKVRSTGSYWCSRCYGVWE